MAFTNIYGKDFLRISSLENSLMLGKNESRKRRGHQRMRWLYGITDAMDMNLDKLRKMVREREVWRGRGGWYLNPSPVTCQLFNLEKANI